MKNILIIGCGLLGSSLLRRISKKKIAKKIFIYEKSKSNLAKIKRLKLPGTIVKSLKEGTSNSDLIIFCTPMSEYKNIILKININKFENIFDFCSKHWQLLSLKLHIAKSRGYILSASVSNPLVILQSISLPQVFGSLEILGGVLDERHKIYYL